MNSKQLCKALVAIAALGAFQCAQAAFDLRVDPAPDTIDVGDTSSVDIFLNATGTGVAFIGVGYDLLFDETILSVDSAATNAAVFDGLDIADTSTAGVIKFQGLIAPPPPSLSGDVLLANVTFSGIAAGTSDLKFAFPGFTPAFLDDGIALPIPPGGVVLPDTEQTGAITVNSPTPAPLPSTLALFAFAGLLGLRRLF